MKNKHLTALALVLPLAACGGSGTQAIEDIVAAIEGGTIDPSVIPALAEAGSGDLTVAEIEAAIDDIGDEFGELIEDDEYTDLASLPQSGEAKFSGVFGLGDTVFGTDEDGEFVETLDPDDAIIVGEMNLTLAFADNELSGDVINLYYRDDEEQISGTLDVAATLDRDVEIEDEFSIFGSIMGDLTDSQGEFSVNVAIDADQYGDNSAVLYGLGDGLITAGGNDDVPVSVTFGLINQALLD